MESNLQQTLCQRSCFQKKTTKNKKKTAKKKEEDDKKKGDQKKQEEELVEEEVIKVNVDYILPPEEEVEDSNQLQYISTQPAEI